MKKTSCSRALLLFLCWIATGAIIPAKVLSQQGAILEGTVFSTRGESLPGVHIFLPGPDRGTITDERGYFLLDNLPPGNYVLTISMVGFKTHRDTLVLKSGERIQREVILRPITIQSEEVVVTASRRGQLTGRVPVSMSTLSGSELNTRNPVSLDEALVHIPGVQLYGNQVNVRGSSGFAYGVGSRVLLLVDGVPLLGPDQGNIQFEGFPLTQLERIEVLKSPGSALYGNGALGGVINLITRDFSDRPRTTVRLYAGAYEPVRYEQWRTTWDKADQFKPAGGIVVGHDHQVNERFGYWATGMFRTDTGHLEMSSIKGGEAYAKLGWRFQQGVNLDLYTSLKRVVQDQFFFWNGLDDVLRPGRIDLGDDTVVGANDGLADQLVVLPVFTHVINPRLYYTVKGRVFGVAFRPIDDEGKIRDKELHTKGFRYGGEIQFNHTPAERMELTAGGSFDANVTSSILYLGEDSLQVRNQPEGAVFLQADYGWQNGLTVSGGLRFNAYRIHTLDVARKLSPKLSFSYPFSGQIIVRASYGHGFRVPSVAERFISNRELIPLESNITLEPEESVGYEIGASFSNSLTDRSGLKTDISLFWNEYDKLVEPQFLPSIGAFQFVNIPRARIRGAEIEMNYSTFDERRQIRVGYTFLDARDLSRDQPLVFRSRHLLQASGRFYLTDWLEIGSDFRAASSPDRLDSDFARFVDDADVFPPVYLTDLRLRFHWQPFAGVKMTQTLQVNNLFDYYHVERPALMAPPRYFQLTVETSW